VLHRLVLVPSEKLVLPLDDEFAWASLLNSPVWEGCLIRLEGIDGNKFRTIRRAEIVLEAVRASRRRQMILDAVNSFYIYRTDTNMRRLARGCSGV
jgi:hypothetical protein